MEDSLRQIITNFLGEKEAHASLREAVKDFPLDLINAQPPNVPYTFWHLLEHIRIAQWDILEYIKNPKHQSPDWPEGYWPKKSAKTDEAGWQKTLDQYEKDRKELVKIVSDPKTDALKEVPHMQGNTILREAILVIDHSAYHIGEFSILRQVMNAW